LQRLELVACQYVSPDWVDELRQFVPVIFWDGEDSVGETHLDDSDEDYYPPSSDLDDSDSDGSDDEAGLHDSGENFYALSSRLEISDSDKDRNPPPSASDSDISDEEGTTSSESIDWMLEVH
jgi:hypothetical protein